MTGASQRPASRDRYEKDRQRAYSLTVVLTMVVFWTCACQVVALLGANSVATALPLRRSIPPPLSSVPCGHEIWTAPLPCGLMSTVADAGTVRWALAALRQSAKTLATGVLLAQFTTVRLKPLWSAVE